MARGGYRPGAGRPTGTTKAQKQKDAENEAANEAKGKTPLEYMLSIMNDAEADAARRDRMAIAAAPFVHSRAGEVGKKDAKKEAAEAAAKGKFAPKAPPRLVVSNG